MVYRHHNWSFNFGWIFTIVCSEGSNGRWVSIVCGDGLAPNWRQTVTWTNVDHTAMLHMASLGYNDKRKMFHRPYLNHHLSTGIAKEMPMKFFYMYAYSDLRQSWYAPGTPYSGQVLSLYTCTVLRYEVIATYQYTKNANLIFVHKSYWIFMTLNHLLIPLDLRHSVSVTRKWLPQHIAVWRIDRNFSCYIYVKIFF